MYMCLMCDVHFVDPDQALDGWREKAFFAYGLGSHSAVV